MTIKAGSIYVVATPIGNLADMTPRAIETLQQVDLVLAEDTRHSLPLLKHFHIQTRCESFHEHNERSIAERICDKVEAGESVALISDAGVPLISDPGFPLIQLAHQRQIKVVPIPGACAAITAISASGLATDRFTFEGFLPAKKGARCKTLEQLEKEKRTLVFYESPRRLIECLEDMIDVFGPQRQAVLAREITKLFETIRKAPLIELLEFVRSDENQCKGEIVLLVEGDKSEDSDQVDLALEKLLTTLLNEIPLKQAVKIAVSLTGLKKNIIYPRALEIKNGSSSE